MSINKKKVIIVGAGIAGLVSATTLACRGYEVIVIERSTQVGGKIRQVQIGDALIDSGPTVFTMRDVFEHIFEDAGAILTDYIKLQPLSILARHSWDADQRLDLFADRNQTADAISNFSNTKNGKQYLAFCNQTKTMFNALDKSFIRAQRPNPLSLMLRASSESFSHLWHIKPFAKMWSSLHTYFDDPRLQQLFGRYATYCGSSPFSSPATLMLIAHVEQNGVWTINGGMQELVKALQKLATLHGVKFLFEKNIKSIDTKNNKVISVTCDDNEKIHCDAVISNADVAALKTGKLGAQVKKAVPFESNLSSKRSLSAMTWSLHETKSKFPLLRHNVFFSNNYKHEFDELFKFNQIPNQPTVYICAQDRQENINNDSQKERLFCLINAPANGDVNRYDSQEIDACASKTMTTLRNCGMDIKITRTNTIATTPNHFNQLFPETGGALYGQATHGWKASFQRPGSRSLIQGLYLAGGSTHPGPGVPMAAISGLLAAQSLVLDLRSTETFHPVATHGGMLTQ